LDSLKKEPSIEEQITLSGYGGGDVNLQMPFEKISDSEF